MTDLRARVFEIVAAFYDKDWRVLSFEDCLKLSNDIISAVEEAGSTPRGFTPVEQGKAMGSADRA